jgi:DNA-binding GntR family transcriptional regulator
MVTKELLPIRTISKSQEVFQRLREGIWSGDLAPGTSLKEAHIARQLNVSQVPVREALLQLEHLGLVVKVPDHGTTVTNLTRAETLQINEVRSSLEELAFRLSARRMSGATENELRKRLSHMERLEKMGDLFGIAEEDFLFHRDVWRNSGNDILSQTLERLCTPLYAFVSLKRHSAGEKMVRSQTELHQHLLELLVAGKEENVVAGIREHLHPRAVIPDSISE